MKFSELFRHRLHTVGGRISWLPKFPRLSACNATQQASRVLQLLGYSAQCREHRRLQQSGTNAGNRAVLPKSYWAVIMSNHIQLRAILIPELHALRPPGQAGGYSGMRNSPGSGSQFVAMLM